MDNLSFQNLTDSNIIVSINNIDKMEVPAAGTLVDERTIRKAGNYVLSPNFRSTIISGISQYLCKKENTNLFYTIKILPLKNNEGKSSYLGLMAREILHTEYSLLNMLSDVQGVVKVHEIFKDYALEERPMGQNFVYTGKVIQRICMVLDCYTPLDYCNKYVNLQHYIIQQKRLSEKQAISIFHKILLKVEILHNRNIVHRDLKLGNFLYDRLTHEVFLFNFGLGKHLPNENFPLTDQKGSPAYISPDVISGKSYTGKPSDMWALGVLLYAMLYGQFPFHDTKSESLFDKIRAGDFVIPTGESSSILIIQLMKGLLTLNPTQRFTVKQALEHVAHIVSEFKGSSRDNSLQVVPDINNLESTSKDNSSKFDRKPLERKSDEIVKINLLSVKQYETTLQGIGNQIPIQQIGQDARIITPSEMAQFSQLLHRIPFNESSLTMTTARNSSREVPELQPNTSNQHQMVLPRHRHLQLTSEQEQDRTPWRFKTDRRVIIREKDRPRVMPESRQPNS